MAVVSLPAAIRPVARVSSSCSVSRSAPSRAAIRSSIRSSPGSARFAAISSLIYARNAPTCAVTSSGVIRAPAEKAFDHARKRSASRSGTPSIRQMMRTGSAKQ